MSESDSSAPIPPATSTEMPSSSPPYRSTKITVLSVASMIIGAVGLFSGAVQTKGVIGLPASNALFVLFSASLYLGGGLAGFAGGIGGLYRRKWGWVLMSASSGFGTILFVLFLVHGYGLPALLVGGYSGYMFDVLLINKLSEAEFSQE